MSIDIKEATADQFEEIWPIFREIVRSGETYPYPMNTDLEEARSLWFAPGARVYFAYLGGVAVASRYIVPNKPGLGAHVCNTGVMVDAAVRGQGIGKKMMDFGLAKAKELGFKAIQLNLVVSTNSASLEICKRNGFQIIGTLPHAFHIRGERYVDAHVLYRELT